MAKISINGLLLDRIAGTGNRILFVHGSNGGAWYWENFMNWFSSKGYECYAINLRYHAPNPSTPEQIGAASIFDYITDVKSVLSEIGEDTILIGHSMGGLIAQNIAGTTPNLKAAIFACTAPPKGIKFKIVIPLKILFRVIKNMKAQKVAIENKLPLPLDEKIAIAYTMNTIPRLEAVKYYKKFIPESSKVFLEVMEGVPCNLSCVKFPILTVGVKKDKTTHWKMEERIAKMYKTDFILFKDMCHMFMIDSGWEQSAVKLLAWLRSKGL